MKTFPRSKRLQYLTSIALVAAVLLFAKVLLTILAEYRYYFPPDFEAAFLSGREAIFVGLYRIAFYAHIVAGPASVLIGSLLMISGGKRRFATWHRRAGRVLLMIALLVVVPSGMVMAAEAHAGPIAGAGFATLSIATAVTAAVAGTQARRRRYASHRRWATRCFILLSSPLLLRLISGAFIVIDLEADWTYQMNAWASWLVPLSIYEVCWRSGMPQSVLMPTRFSAASEGA